jgi:hypothetical protein
MKKYVKEIEGKKVYKTRQQIVISKNGMSTYNPTEEMILSDGWVEYVYIEHEKTIEEYKNEKINEIKHYDESSLVNEFYIQGLPVWLDKTTRVGLKLRFESEIAMGKTETSLWYDDIQFPLQLENAMQMLFAIELYASACYDNTHYHISRVNVLENIEDIKNYDYTIGYPEKLQF